MTFTKNFTEIVSGDPLSGGGVNARGISKYSNLSICELSGAKIGGKLVSKVRKFTNRKSYISFRLIPKSVTLNDLGRRNGPYLALFYRLW